MRQRLALLTTVLACAAQPDPGDGLDGPLHDRLTARITARESELIAFRRDLHRHPELSGQESRTAGAVSRRLRDLGFEVRTGVGGHGVVAVIRGGRPGPVVAFRSDMDAVPSTAVDPVPFPSVTAGIRHICGHDVHTTIGIALAEGFAAIRADLPGTVILVFQPAEERATGARAMLAAGVFDGQIPAAIFAVHTAPLDVGQLGVAAGPFMASRDVVRISATGSGNVTAALEAARALIEAVGTVEPGRRFDPATGDFILVDAGAIGGSSLTATLSLATEAARARAKQTITQGVAALTFPSVSLAVDYQERAIAGVTNDAALTSTGSAAVAAALGANAVVAIRTIIPAFSEDFGSFQEQVPGVMFFLGVSNPATGTVGYPHSPAYVADEAAIVIGARAIGAALLAALGARD